MVIVILFPTQIKDGLNKCLRHDRAQTYARTRRPIWNSKSTELNWIDVKYHTPVYKRTHTSHRVVPQTVSLLSSSLMQKLKILPFKMPLNLFQLVLNLRCREEKKLANFIIWLCYFLLLLLLLLWLLFWFVMGEFYDDAENWSTHSHLLCVWVGITVQMGKVSKCKQWKLIAFTSIFMCEIVCVFLRFCFFSNGFTFRMLYRLSAKPFIQCAIWKQRVYKHTDLLSLARLKCCVSIYSFSH